MGQKIPMRTHQEARHVLTRFIRAYNNGELEDQKFRSLCFGLNILLSFFKTEKEFDFEERLVALEERDR